MADILQLAGGQKIVGLRCGKESLSVAKMFAGFAQADDGAFQISHRSLAHQRETGCRLAQRFDLAF